jgi:3-oxoacyl-[acyl-carrier protein] reductase
MGGVFLADTLNATATDPGVKLAGDSENYSIPGIDGAILTFSRIRGNPWWEGCISVSGRKQSCTSGRDCSIPGVVRVLQTPCDHGREPLTAFLLPCDRVRCIIATMSEIPCILVTGSSRGLGRGVALELARAGMSVAIHCAANRSAAEETAAACAGLAVQAGQQFPVVSGDLGESASRRGVFDQTLAALGRIDALVNNAGITSPGRRDMLDCTEEGWDSVMNVNLKGPFFLSQMVARWWLEHPGEDRLPRGYKLVFVTSVSAVLGSVNRGDYCISKTALGMASQLWALRLAEHGIQVVEFRPGIMETDMTAGVKEKYDPIIASGTVPMRRWGQPEDVGKGVRSFLEGALPFSTGEVIYMDGGLRLGRL